MDSKETGAKKNEDSSTKRVLEYYKKFSQNKDLPKYFSGTSVSYLPEFEEKLEDFPTDIDCPTDIIIKTDVDVDIIITTEDDDKQVEEHEEASSASSALSNRKLEWDSLADIGYNNLHKIEASKGVTLKRSSSLPLVLEDHKFPRVDGKFVVDEPGCSKFNRHYENVTSDNRKVFMYNYSTSSSSNKEQEFFSSSSSPPQQKQPEYSSSSSCNSPPEKKYSTSSDSSSTQHISNFVDTLLYLKKKVGLPDAQSTPNAVDEFIKSKKETSDTPVSNKSVKHMDTDKKSSPKKSMSSKPEHEKNVTKASKKKPSRVINLCITKPVSLECIASPQKPKSENVEVKKNQATIGIQTESITEKELIKIITKTQNDLNQSVLFYAHSESDSNTCSTQTDSNIVASKCDSFEYVKQVDIKETCEILETNISHDLDNIIPNLQKVTMKCTNLQKSQREDLKPVTSEDSHSEEIVLSKTNDKITDDIENKIYVLQKLIKSKKYDDHTKKHYIKKIIQKITESKYWDESSNSSDLFYPKKAKENAQKLAHTRITDNSSSSSSHKGILKKTDLPDEKIKVSPRKKCLEVKTTVQEILPGRAQKDDFTTSASEILPIDSLSKNKIKSSNSESQKSSNNTSLEKQYESSVNSKHLSYQNWKDDKTISEKLFEEKCSSSGDGDYVTPLASKDREQQLNWINNEIEHLAKLKTLLEYNEKNLKNPVVPSNSRQTTSVYYVSENNKENPKRKKYVIQTEVCSNLRGRRHFHLDGRNYILEDRADVDQRPTRQVLSAIKVTDSNTTTNIKVKTFCEECKRSPCVCIPEYIRNACHGSASNSSKENVCLKCAGIAPICTCINFNRTVCIDCHKTPCICTERYKTGAIPKKCRKCNSYPCECSQNIHRYSDHGDPNYVGQFIPASGSSKCSKSTTSPHDCCSTCRKYQCMCEEHKLPSHRSSQKSGVSYNVDFYDSSLKRVFENCQCSFQKKCNCEFVDKLLKHFNKEQCQRDCNILTNRGIQVDTIEKVRKFETQPASVQTRHKACNRTMQTSGSEKCMRLAQTENSYQNIGTQFRSAKIQENVQTPDELIPYKSPPRKPVCQISAQTEVLKPPEKKVVNTQTNDENPDFVLRKISLSQILENSNAPCHRPKSAEVQRTVNIEMLPRRPRSADVQTSRRCVVFKEMENEMPSCTNVPSYTNIPSCRTIPLTRSTSSSTNMNKKDQHTQSQQPHSIDIQTQSQQPISTDTQTKRNVIVLNDTETQMENPTCESIQTLKEESTSNCCQTETMLASEQLQTEKVDFNSVYTQIEPQCRTEAVQTSDWEDNVIECVDSESICCPLNIPVVVKEEPLPKTVANKSQQVKVCKSNKRAGVQPKKRVTYNSKVQTGPSLNDLNNDMSSTSCSTTISNSSSCIICACCKRPTPADTIGILKQNNQEFPFCARCIKAKPMLTTICYSGSQHVCNCQESESTTELGAKCSPIEEYCSCVKPYSKRRTQYCSHCQHKLQKTVKSKNSIAYCLTLQCENPNKLKSKKKKRKQQLEEIRVKVPSMSFRKMHKNKQNCVLKDNECYQPCKQRDEDNIENASDEETETKSVSGDKDQKEKQRTYTLQEYLLKNRPDFIDSAEYRRRAVLSSKLGRAITKDEEKLKFLEENLKNEKLKKEHKLFSEKEMREITQRNYKKLPEVQQKLKRSREEKLRNADKFIVNTFTKKLQGSILKGKSRFPIDRKVIDMK